jgi:hypothetical protein
VIAFFPGLILFSLIEPPFSSGLLFLLLTEVNGLDGGIFALFQLIQRSNQPTLIVPVRTCPEDGSDASSTRLGNCMQIVDGKRKGVFRMTCDSESLSHANETLLDGVKLRWCWVLMMCHFLKSLRGGGGGFLTSTV